MDTTPSNPSLIPRRPSTLGQGVLYGLTLLAARILQIVLIYLFTHGVEFATDVEIQRLYIADPLQLLLGRATTYDVFPPLFPLLLWTLNAPWSAVLPPFLAYRATMATVELLAWPLVWWLICKAGSGRDRHLLAIAYIVAPMCWVTTTIMCQDEAISMVFFAAVSIAIWHDRRRLAILLCGLAVVIAKIYFLVPLVGLLGLPMNRSWRTWVGDAAIGVAPIIAVYGLQAILTGRAGVAIDALDRFVIPYEMSVSIWALLNGRVGDETARRVSGVVAFCLSMLPLAIMWIRGKPTPARQQIQVIVAMLTWVYLGFFHINPEYYLIIVPGLFVALRPVIAAGVLVIGFSIPWAVNFFYGVQIGIERGDPGRAPFVRIYQAVTSLDPSIAHRISVVAFFATTLALAVLLTRNAAMKPASAQVQL